MILKVQVPIMTSPGAEPLALVYDKDKKFQTHLPIDFKIKKLMNGSVKQFFFARFDENTGKLELGRKAPWQEW